MAHRITQANVYHAIVFCTRVECEAMYDDCIDVSLQWLYDTDHMYLVGAGHLAEVEQDINTIELWIKEDRG